LRILALDTATPVTTVALLDTGGAIYEAADTPPAGSRGHHAQAALILAAGVLADAGLAWAELDLVGVGVGPGGYTGLRIGLATARGIARSSAAALEGVGTLRALAEPLAGQTALALIDARRGELFTAAYLDDVEVLRPQVIAPDMLAGLLAPGAVAVGDGALAHRPALERAGHRVPPDGSPLHAVSAAAICRIAAAGGGGEPLALYLRRPDAERSLDGQPR
jgi:tRNA threonylcarbamoyladenosine biosynthesis protein TsaB